MTGRRTRLLSVALVLLAGCADRAASAPSAPSSAPPAGRDTIAGGLRVDVRVASPRVERPEDLRVLVSIGNPTGAAVRLNGLSLDIAQLVLAVQSEDGTPVHPG